MTAASKLRLEACSTFSPLDKIFQDTQSQHYTCLLIESTQKSPITFLNTPGKSPNTSQNSLCSNIPFTGAHSSFLQQGNEPTDMFLVVVFNWRLLAEIKVLLRVGRNTPFLEPRDSHPHYGMHTSETS